MGAAILLLMVMGCDNSTSPNQDLKTSHDIPVTMQSGDAVNATHNELPIYTTDGFYFLPPMVKDAEYSGNFDPDLSPVVEICETPACDAFHASFDMDGEGSEQVRVDEEDEHYIANWSARSTGAEAGQTYRLRVLVNDLVLGHADVHVVRNGRDANEYRSAGEVAIVANQTLPVKFRVETGIVGSIILEPAEATIEIGETQQFTATLYDLHGEPLDGPDVVWSSDNDEIADVDGDGLASGITEGGTIIIGKSGLVSGSASLVVTTTVSNGTVVVDVISATGRVWMDRNLGASRAAISSTDSEAYGDLYQWGRYTDGHQVITSGTTSTLSNSNTPRHGYFIKANSSPFD